MARKEEIRQASIEYTFKNRPTFICGDMEDELYQNPAFEEGAKWADKNPNPQAIVGYLYKEKGYPISLNGEIPTFEETMKDVQVYNDYKKKQWIEKAVKWVKENFECYVGADVSPYYIYVDEFVEDFSKAMEE